MIHPDDLRQLLAAYYPEPEPAPEPVFRPKTWDEMFGNKAMPNIGEARPAPQAARVPVGPTPGLQTRPYRATGFGWSNPFPRSGNGLQPLSTYGQGGNGEVYGKSANPSPTFRRKSMDEILEGKGIPRGGAASLTPILEPGSVAAMNAEADAAAAKAGGGGQAAPGTGGSEQAPPPGIALPEEAPPNPYSGLFPNLPSISVNPPISLEIGDNPPPPPGYGPDWGNGRWPNKKPWTKPPTDQATPPGDEYWTVHPEDEGHWPHWDVSRPETPGSNQHPPNAGKRRPIQEEPLNPGQSEENPNESTDQWRPPDEQPEESQNPEREVLPEWFYLLYPELYPYPVPGRTPGRVPGRVPIIPRPFIIP